MSVIVNGTGVKKILYNGNNIKRGYCNGVLVFTSDHTVQYVIKGQTWSDSVEDGGNAVTSSANSTASGKLGTGDTFVGWTKTSGSTSPSSSIPCTSDGMKLYGIWKHKHSGTADVYGGCFQGSAVTANPIRNTGDDGTVTHECGCRSQVHHYHCDICDSDFSTETNSNANCTRSPKHTVSDDYRYVCQHWGETVTTYQLSCGKTEGTFCG